MLVLSRKSKQKIIISDNIEIEILSIEGDQVKIGINAPKDIDVNRYEVYEAIKKENNAASKKINIKRFLN
ncbi:carbon storage regulator [Halolactibacillus alkaliphilus]|uniref:Translational regulator CsrA n=1 Tax=Halolactibacillus alkaliphilus TaxID=442899 RepID=A0A511X2D3_9BACI|nr:carbon storage regulator CsrA [Halolactibacillus alkaliphilus]GEN57098.1 carbon storage regulator [Halolactibacillus alkaliphilus]GGN71914.1 carbon storage regulator [Halolactibacillus alkaliphilus]SFO86809.1 carbon storage regulator, CsrA [Halolactibacillus alkaliphilus]